MKVLNKLTYDRLRFFLSRLLWLCTLACVLLLLHDLFQMNCYVCYQEWSFLTLGIFGFGHFLGRFFGFWTEKLLFLGFVGCGFRFFDFLAPGFLTKIKQVRFLSGSLCSPDVRLFYMFLFYCQSRSNCNVGLPQSAHYPPTSPKHDLQGRIRGSSRAKMLSKVAF